MLTLKAIINPLKCFVFPTQSQVYVQFNKVIIKNFLSIFHPSFLIIFQLCCSSCKIRMSFTKFRLYINFFLCNRKLTIILKFQPNLLELNNISRNLIFKVFRVLDDFFLLKISFIFMLLKVCLGFNAN